MLALAPMANRRQVGTLEFEASQQIYRNFLNTMRDLSVFQLRHDWLVFTRAAGAPVRVVPVTVR